MSQMKGDIAPTLTVMPKRLPASLKSPSRTLGRGKNWATSSGSILRKVWGNIYTHTPAAIFFNLKVIKII